MSRATDLLDAWRDAERQLADASDRADVRRLEAEVDRLRTEYQRAVDEALVSAEVEANAEPEQP